MNAAWLYRQAEELVETVRNGLALDTALPGSEVEVITTLLANAQVHATLALAAATAHGTCGISPEGKSSTELYHAVVGDPEPTR